MIMKVNFRPGLNDEIIFNTASDLNEYLLPDVIDADDIIIDIGAHIGGFIYGCLKRGARNIFAYESHKGNYDIGLAGFDEEIMYGSVKLYNLAVWRSDIEDTVLYNSGFCDPGNSGTNVVVYDTEKNNPVNTISLDEIISSVAMSGRRIKLIKIDCEGSEFPILFTSKRLKEVDYICGEYHMIDLCNFTFGGKSRFTDTDLYNFLDSQGFRVVMFKNPLNCLIGLFYAKKKTLKDNYFKILF